MGNKYKISDVAKVLDISPELVRHYERKGILTPKRNENGYREYSTRDINILTGLRKLIKMGYSLESIEFSINQASLDEVIESLDNLEKKTIKEIRQKQLILEVIRKQKVEFHMLYDNENKFFIKQSPSVYRIQFQYKMMISIDEAVSLNVGKWIENMPIVSVSPEFSIEDIYNNLEDFNFGLIVDKDLAEELDLINTPGIKLIPSQLCLTTIIKSEGADHIKPIMLQNAVRHMKDNNMKMINNAWGKTIGSFVKNNIHQKYHEIFIPIEYNSNNN